MKFVYQCFSTAAVVVRKVSQLSRRPPETEVTPTKVFGLILNFHNQEEPH